MIVPLVLKEFQLILYGKFDGSYEDLVAVLTDYIAYLSFKVDKLNDACVRVLGF